MRKLLGTLLLAAATAASATEVGRLKLDHPALGTAGGSALHTLINNIYTKISDNADSRYFTHSAIANSTTVTEDHNFGVALDELTVRIYTGTHPNLTRVADPVASGWTIAATGGFTKTKIDVTTPGSGGPHTFAVVVINAAGAEKLDDLDDVDLTTPAEEGQTIVWDTTSSTFKPGASGDSSFKCQAVSDPNLTLKGGYLVLNDGRELATYDGAGSASTDFGVDETINLDTVLGSNPANATAYYLYIDTQALGAAVTQTDTGRKVYAVTTSQLSLQTTTPESALLTRYVPLCFIKSATTGTVWSGSGAAFGTTAFRKHDSYNAPVQTYTTGTLTAAPSFPLSHGLSTTPRQVSVLTKGQSLSGQWDLRNDLCSWTSTQITCDLSSLTIGVGNEVEIIASAGNQAIALPAADATTVGTVTTSAQTFAGAKTFTGAILGSDGSVTAPSFALSSDADGTGTGLYRVGANNLGFAANGVQSGNISSAGLWSIGPVAGGVTHAIRGSASVSEPLLVADGTVSAPSLAFSSDNDGSGTGIYRIGANNMGFAANGVNVANLTSVGNLGLGVAPSSLQRLYHQSNVNNIADTIFENTNSGTSARSRLQLKTDVVVAELYAGNNSSGVGGAGTNSNHDFTLYRNGSTKITVGTETTAFAAPAGAITGTLGIDYQWNPNADGQASGMWVTRGGTILSGSGGYQMTGGTRVGYMQMRDSAPATNYLWFNASTLYTGTSGANVGSATGTVVGTQTSDERVKSDIKPLEYGLKEALALKPIRYKRNGKVEIGFGAQSTKPVVPEAVYVTGEPVNPKDPKSPKDKMAMDYVRLIPVLVNAIKEQQEEIESLKKLIKE